MAIMTVVYGLCFLFTHDEGAKVFLMQSIVDNGVFCGFFLIIAWATGMSC